jgi:hypothetical protein
VPSIVPNQHNPAAISQSVFFRRILAQLAWDGLSMWRLSLSSLREVAAGIVIGQRGVEDGAEDVGGLTPAFNCALSAT